MSDHGCPKIVRKYASYYLSGYMDEVRPDNHCDICHARVKERYGRYLKYLPELRLWVEGDDVSNECRHLLYDLFHEDMPYGTQKARDGDPDQWLADHPEYVEELIATIEFYYPEMAQKEAVNG